MLALLTADVDQIPERYSSVIVGKERSDRKTESKESKVSVRTALRAASETKAARTDADIPREE